MIYGAALISGETFQSGGEKIVTPQCNIAVAGICAETEARAYQLLEQHDNDFIVPSVVGTASQCRKKLHVLQDRYGVNEIIFLDVCQDLDNRLRSYELLATEFELTSVSTSAKL